MATDSDTSRILGLYKQLCTAIERLEDGDTSDTSDGDSSGLEIELRALCIELSQIINVDDAEYSPDIKARVRVIEREVRSLTGRVNHSKSKSSSLSW